MVNDKELADLIAREIFRTGDEQPHDKVQRIQFMGGVYPGRETMLGGLCEESLARVIESTLAQHRSY